MGKAETCRKLAHRRKLGNQELSLRQRVMLWLAVDAWIVDEPGEREHSPAEASEMGTSHDNRGER
jgi:hypothetical protein